MSPYKIAVSAVTIGLIGSGVSWADDVQSEALKFAEQQNYDAALNVLDSAEPDQEAALDRRLLKARLLSWAGRYAEAETLLLELKAEHPNAADIEVTFGSLFYYQGKLEPAEKHFASALQLAPDNQDARSGHARVLNAKEARRVANLKWRVDAGGSYSTFKDSAADDWNEQFVSVQRKTGDVAVSVKANQYKRFGKSDTQITVGIDDAKRGGVDWGVYAASTPDADFRPKTTVGGRVGGSIKVTEEISTYLALHVRRDQFDTGDVQSVQPELTTYFSNGLELTGKVILTDQENADTQTGYLVQGVYPVADTVRLKLGYADAPEVINGQAVSTKSYFGGVSFDVTDTLSFNINAARQDRADNITRDDFSIGFTRKF